LDQGLSVSEIQSLRKRFTVTDGQARDSEQSDYYATKLPPGPARLAEMLEESALYTEEMQRLSAKAMLLVLGFFVVVFVVLTMAVTPFVERDTFYLAMRIFLAMLVFAMSADVLGAYRLHQQAAEEVKDIRNRLMIADKTSYPLPDVLLIFTDYNTAVESAPESVPLVYRLYREDLKKRWETYQEDRKRARAKR
jgi:sensor histidine kinase YesM